MKRTPNGVLVPSTLIPWDDLGVKGRPVEESMLDVLDALQLSYIVGRQNATPHLVKVDAGGAILFSQSSSAYYPFVATVSIPQGATVTFTPPPSPEGGPSRLNNAYLSTDQITVSAFITYDGVVYSTNRIGQITANNAAVSMGINGGMALRFTSSFAGVTTVQIVGTCLGP